MNSYVRVRACPSPSNFFDELIPADGLEVCGWRLSMRTIPAPVWSGAGNHTVVDTRWLYAESDYEETQLAHFARDGLAAFHQLIKVLEGVRLMHLSGSVTFSMFFTEFVKDRVSRNIEPYQINAGIDKLSVRITDGNGKVVFDAAEHEAQQARQALQNAQENLRADGARLVKHLDDEYFRRAWESFGLALGEDEHAIGHLYDVRDAIVKKLGGEVHARTKLNLRRAEWDDFGSIFNSDSVKGGRHNGRHPTPMRAMTHGQRQKVIRFARTMLLAYGDYLEDGDTAAMQVDV
ncbi:hypothetical protein [Paraburkholderia youngii]|uniref:hypothetical protein n=1 Tax=Paraburkholderia youngii TaxID=2782701 RepID=UPI003D1C2256